MRGVATGCALARRLRGVIADAHLDLLLELGYRELRFGETGAFARTWLPLLEAGGVGLQVCPVFVELERQPEGTLREALGQATCLLRAVRESPERVVQVRTASDLDAVERGERIGLMLSLEGVEQFGYETWPAETFWELGMRMAGLTWNRRNPFADGAAEDGGLSRLGRALVDELVELGVILDLAHASPATFDEIIARAAGAPVICTHAACRSVNDHPRNLTDDQLRALAAAGGLFGLMLHPLAIGHEQRTLGSRRGSSRARGRRDRDRPRVPRRRLHDAAERGHASDARARRRADAGRPRAGRGNRRAQGAGGLPGAPGRARRPRLERFRHRRCLVRRTCSASSAAPCRPGDAGERRQSAAPPSASSVAPFT